MMFLQCCVTFPLAHFRRPVLNFLCVSHLDLQDLMEQLEKQDKTVRKLKKQLKVFAKKIGELEGI